MLRYIALLKSADIQLLRGPAVKEMRRLLLEAIQLYIQSKRLSTACETKKTSGC